MAECLIDEALLDMLEERLEEAIGEALDDFSEGMCDPELKAHVAAAAVQVLEANLVNW